MIERIYKIPQDIIGAPLASINGLFYQSNQPLQKGKVQFARHALIWVVQGQKEVIGPKGILRGTPEQLLLLPGGNILMTERQPTTGPYQSFLFFFTTEWLQEFALPFLTKYQPEKICDGLGLIPRDNYLDHFEQSLHLLYRQNNWSQDLVEAKVREVLTYLVDYAPEKTYGFFQQALATNAHFNFRQLIANQDLHHLTNEERAFLCNMSVSTFKRRFAEVFQTSPQRYFIELRMQKAQRWLQQGKLPSQIFWDLGYESLAAFSGEFKKHTGYAPSKFPGKVTF
ncbi:MAG: helix-turn-helix transcriptional regulator [Bacteroidota bacterium]